MSENNWNQIKQALKENFIEQDMDTHATFSSIDFDKGLEIFRYLLNLKLLNHDKTHHVFDALQLYSIPQLNKSCLKDLVSGFEPFCKKLMEKIHAPYTPPRNNPDDVPALGWCYRNLFNKLSINDNNFFKTNTLGKIKQPKFRSVNFFSLFTDGTPYGVSLHKSYHLRNSDIHNDPAIKANDIAEYIKDCIISYLYFTFKYYPELCSVISDADLLEPVVSLEIKNLASLSGGNYNPCIENEVKREGVIQTIIDKLENNNVLFIEGNEGIGKTTILHQFVTAKPDSCLAYFIDGKDKNTYSTLPILQSYCNQIHYYLKKEELEDTIGIDKFNDENMLKSYFSSMVTNNKIKQKVYLILDGIDEISEDFQNEIKEHILDVLPYSKNNIKLILTGKKEKKLFTNNIELISWEPPVLSLSEAKVIIGNNVSDEDFNHINKICKYNAGKIVFIRELITKSKIPVENIINNLRNDMNILFQYLWNQIEKDKETQMILAILALQEEKYTAYTIARILDKDEDSISGIIQNIKLLRKNSRNTYEFIFDDLRIFAQKQLDSFKKAVDDQVIKYLTENSDSEEALINLLEIYNHKGAISKQEELLKEEKWKQYINRTRKISKIIKVSATALDTITRSSEHTENKHIPTILKYSILQSASKELSRTSIWKYEIAANLVLKDYISASNLANLAFLKEDKLKMFASIAKNYAKQKQQIPKEITETIQSLFDEIDFKSIKNLGVELASLLMYSSPKLAFRLIEDLSGSISDNDNAFDWALAQISFNMYSDIKNLEDVSKEDVNTKVYSKIRNPKIKEFADAIIYISENQSYEEILSKVGQLESTSQKLFLLRNWIFRNQNNENIADIIEIGIDLVVNKSDKYVPKSNDFKLFSLPLSNIKDEQKLEKLITKIEDYSRSIESNSGINDILAIKLNIAQAIFNFSHTKGESKLFDIYSEIVELNDPIQKAQKVTYLAIFARAAKVIKMQYQEFNLDDMYIETAREEIRANIDSILAETASHFEITQDIITNLVILFPKDAIEICNKLNKSIDRDNAYLECLSTYLNQEIDKIDTSTLSVMLDRINDLDINKIALSEIIQRISNESKSNDLYERFSIFIEKVDLLIDYKVKLTLYIQVCSILEKEGKSIENITNKIKDVWNELTNSAEKIELGFEIAYKASFINDKKLANEFKLLAEEEKRNPNMLLDSPTTANVLYLTIELLLKAFSGLIIKDKHIQDDINKINNIINSLPSEANQIQLWAYLGLKILSKKKDNTLSKTIIETILSKLQKITNRLERTNIIIDIIPILYFNNKDLPFLDEFPGPKLKDIALSRVCNYLLSKCCPNDSCDDNGEGYIINFDTAKDILDLTNKMSNDYFIASQIEDLRKSINNKYSAISQQQKIELNNLINRIADHKLPDNNNIKHDGYKILVKANATALYSNSKKESWKPILEQIEKIPNLSDRIFMWVCISKLLPEGKDKQELIKKANTQAYNLPSFIDTVQRLDMIIYSMKGERNQSSLKEVFETFMNILKDRDVNPKLKNNYRNVLDAIYSVDPNLAKAYINIFDKDQARIFTGAYLQNHYNFLQLQSKAEKLIKESKSSKELFERNPHFLNQYSEFKLSRLNACKNPHDKLAPRDFIYQLNLAAKDSIYKTYNTFAYFIERLVLQYENTNESEKIIRKSFLALLEACELIKFLSIRNANKIQNLLDIMQYEPNAENDIDEIKIRLGDENVAKIKKLHEHKLPAIIIAETLGIDKNDIEIVINSF